MIRDSKYDTETFNKVNGTSTPTTFHVHVEHTNTTQSKH